MTLKRKRFESEKERRREDAAVENEKNARAWAFKRINRSLPNEFEKEKIRLFLLILCRRLSLRTC